jgi:hypothetical protein
MPACFWKEETKLTSPSKTCKARTEKSVTNGARKLQRHICFSLLTYLAHRVHSVEGREELRPVRGEDVGQRVDAQPIDGISSGDVVDPRNELLAYPRRSLVQIHEPREPAVLHLNEIGVVVDVAALRAVVAVVES